MKFTVKHIAAIIFAAGIILIGIGVPVGLNGYEDAREFIEASEKTTAVVKQVERKRVSKSGAFFDDMDDYRYGIEEFNYKYEIILSYTADDGERTVTITHGDALFEGDVYDIYYNPADPGRIILSSGGSLIPDRLVGAVGGIILIMSGIALCIAGFKISKIEYN